MKVLIVDDSRAMRAILGQMLGAVNIEAEQAANGSEALDYLKNGGEADLIMIDWNMPVMNGYELVQAIRGESKFNDIPLMMVTSETETSQVQKALEAGANEYIIKPFTKEGIQEKLSILGLTQV